MCEKAAARTAELLIGDAASACIYYHIVLGQELAGNVGSRLQVSSAVLLQVDDEIYHALGAKFLDSLHHFSVGGLCEVIEADEADARCDHVGSIHRVDGNLVAHHVEVQSVAYLTSHHAQIHVASLLAAQAVHDFLTRHLHAGYRSVVDRHDAVACQYAHLLAGSLGYRLDDHKSVLEHVELHAYSLERTFERLGELLRLLGIGVGRVRVELFQDAVDGILGQPLAIYAIHVVVIYHGCSHDHLLHIPLKLAHRLLSLGRTVLVTELCHCAECHA